MTNRRTAFRFLALAALSTTPQLAFAQSIFNSTMPDLTPFQMLDIARSQQQQRSEVRDANALTFKAQVLDRPGVVLVEFMLPTCGECDPVLHFIKPLVSKYEGMLGYLRLDVDKNPGIGEKYDVSRVPAILVFKDGKLIRKFMVFNAKQKEELTTTLDQQFGIPAAAGTGKQL